MQCKYSMPFWMLSSSLCFLSVHGSLTQYLSLSGPVLSIPLSFCIKSTLPISFYSPVVTNVAFSVNLNKLTLKQTTHSDTGSKTCTHALPQTNTHTQPWKESPMHPDKPTACVKLYFAQRAGCKCASPRRTVLCILEQTATTHTALERNLNRNWVAQEVAWFWGWDLEEETRYRLWCCIWFSDANMFFCVCVSVHLNSSGVKESWKSGSYSEFDAPKVKWNVQGWKVTEVSVKLWK